MQRKNNFLNPLKKRGFAMIMAIILIVVLSTIMAYTLTLTTQTTKQTGDLYLREQAVLLSQSAAEYTLLAISGQPRKDVNTTYPNGNCLGEITAMYPTNGADKMFDINVSIRYIGLNCGAYNYTNPANLTTPDSNGTVLLDITVTSNPNTSTEPIRYFRRTIQKL